MKKTSPLWILALALMLSSCANTRATSKTLNLGRFEKDHTAKNKIDGAVSLYEMGEVDAAIAHLIQLIENSQYSTAQDQAYELLVEWLLQVKRRDEAKRFASFFLNRYPKNPTTQKLVALFSHKDPAKAPVNQASEPEFMGSEHLAPLQDETQPVSQGEDNFSIRSKSIGILLPLSGQYSVFGKRALAAIKIALKLGDITTETNPTIITKNGINIIISDSHGDPFIAENLAQDLINKHHVALMIGDIISEPGLSVAKVCEQNDIPLLSLARHPQVLGLGRNIFVFNSSRETQISELVKYAITTKSYKNFGIIFPRHTYGTTMAKTFYDEVKKQGGSITAMESYEANETTFTSVAKNLVGMLHLDAHPEYAACTSKVLEEKDQLKKNNKIALCKKELKPVVDFEALFIPDFTPLSFLVPALIQEDLLVTNNESAQKTYALATKNSHPKYVQLLGPNSWHDQNIISKLGNLVDGAYFVDALDFSTNPELAEFTAAFQALQMGTPTELEVFAHDAVSVAYALLDTSISPESNQQLRERLTNFNQKVGLLPTIVFDKNQGLVTPVTGFEIIGGTARVVDNQSPH